MNEIIAAQVVPGLALRVQLSFDHHLRGDTGVIGPGLPQRVAATHALVADQGVHNGVLEPMTHVQRAGYIGWRDHDAVGRSFPGRREQPARFPMVVPFFLDGAGVVSLFHSVSGPYCSDL